MSLYAPPGCPGASVATYGGPLTLSSPAGTFSPR